MCVCEREGESGGGGPGGRVEIMCSLLIAGWYMLPNADSSNWFATSRLDLQARITPTHAGLSSISACIRM